MKSQGTKYQVILDLNPRERATALQMASVIDLIIRGTVSEGADKGYVSGLFPSRKRRKEYPQAAWCGWA